MSRKKKLLARLKRRPKDFTWNELASLLETLGYRQLRTGKAGGSRRRVVHPTAPAIALHKPHPQNTLQRYVIDDVLALLGREGMG